MYSGVYCRVRGGWRGEALFVTILRWSWWLWCWFCLWCLWSLWWLCFLRCSCDVRDVFDDRKISDVSGGLHDCYRYMMISRISRKSLITVMFLISTMALMNITSMIFTTSLLTELSSTFVYKCDYERVVRIFSHLNHSLNALHALHDLHWLYLYCTP